ncbi:MAG TPA: sulfatase-like hydrolase/transferase [Sandaracinaceae bacterium LLY-WYZ-13_1]|nr:sulfatase-like hydrolase/transferase [Sandaracinaceae bacterium LLY-WYZ-13_1]
MNRTQQRALLVGLSMCTAAAWAVACGDDEEQSPEETASPDEGGEAADESSEEDPSARVRARLAETRVHLDLQALAHLADVDHHGLYLDFGTPARHHFTMGRWHNGFLSDVQAGERDFTRMGTDARAWFHLDEAGPLTLRFRGRPIGSDAFVVYVNGQRAGQVDFEGNGVQEHDVAVEASLVEAGENALMLRASETRAVQGEEVAVELDSIWVFEGDAPGGELHPPLYSELVGELDVGGQARDALIVRAPTTVRWYAEIPEDARLSFAVGAAGESPTGRARVTVTPEGGEAAQVFEADLSGRWNDQLLDLSRFAGEVVRLEVAVEGDAERVGIAAPALVVPLPDEALSEAQAQSVIVLLIDTLRASKLRAYNPESRVETPTMDAVAEEGAVFENAQAPENWTKPSVASVLTSLTPMTHNTKEQGSSLSPSALMLSEVFQDHDFATASFIANGYVSDRYGFNQGWDHYTNYIREERNTEAGNVFREAIDWIEEHRDERFFAYIQTIDPHVPYDPPDDLLEHYDPGEYDGPIAPRRTGHQLEDAKAGRMELTARDRRRLEALHDGEITYHDREMTRFVERLRELGLYDEVIFVVTSDHGEEFHEHGSYGHGHTIYQELIHVPLIVRWNGVVEPRRVAQTVSTLDIAPTVLEATGIDIPEEFEGQSLLSTARGHHRPGPAIAFTDKLDDRRVATAAGYKLVVRGNLTWAFFNLREDPGEQTQIDDGGRHPIALRYLRGLYGQHLGADDRGNWLTGGTTGESRVLPQSEAQIDAELCRHLQQLGYIDARCNDLL